MISISTRWLTASAAVLLLGVACGDDSAEPLGSAASTTTGEPPPAPVVVIDLVVDANRNGALDPADADEQQFENDWTASRGASFLANLDDDDADGVRDVDDEIVNGEADLADLARIAILAWPEAPDGATGELVIDAVSADHVRVFKRGADGAFSLVAGSLGPCTEGGACTRAPSLALTTDEIRLGLELAIEARGFVTSRAEGAWSGSVELAYGVRDVAGAIIVSDEVPTGADEVQLRVAPWVLFGNLSPFDRVWSSSDSAAFVNGIEEATDDAGIEYERYSNYNDQWTQDFFQTGWTAMPGPDGSVHGIRIANARPWGQSGSASGLPYRWLANNYLGPERGILAIYSPEHEGDGSTYDSHGNHNLLPPYTKGDVEYPLGRIILGSGIYAETKEFYDAQLVQGPHFAVDTSWLWVGHIDEVFSYVPAGTELGWKLLVGSPRMARAMLEAAQAAGHGAVPMFVGKKIYGSGDTLVDAEVTIDEVLADPDLMQWSQEAQNEIDSMLADVQAEVGLTDADIVEIPYLFAEVGGGKIAFNPGTANLLAFGDHVVHPDPFGPEIDGTDLFEKDLRDRLGTPANDLGSDGQGLEVYFTNDWALYHALDGEVHCGTNPEGGAPFSSTRWWETGR